MIKQLRTIIDKYSHDKNCQEIVTDLVAIFRRKEFAKERAIIIRSEWICDKIGFDNEIITLRTRKREIAEKRFMLFYILKTYYFYTLECIGNAYGYDHATVLNGINRIRYFIESEEVEVKKNLATIINAMREQ